METRILAPNMCRCVLVVVTVTGGCADPPPSPSSEPVDVVQSTDVTPSSRANSSVLAIDEELQFRKARMRMIERQLTSAGRQISDKRVLQAMRDVPRHLFVPSSQRDQAYDDSPLPIGYGQTISQPYIVAFMTERLNPQPTDKVLEIGTGSGYQAAVMARLVSEVYSVEIIEPLAERARKTLAELKLDNVHVRAGDGYQGWPEQAPFDAVIVTCAPDQIPPKLCDQLAEGGRMIIPVGQAFGKQELILLEKKEGELKQQSVLPVRFVPMTGGDK